MLKHLRAKNIHVCSIRHTRVCAEWVSHVLLFAAPWTVAHCAPLPVEFSRQEYWSGFPFPTPGCLLDAEIEPDLLRLLHWQADSFPPVPPGKPRHTYIYVKITCVNTQVNTHRNTERVGGWEKANRTAS